MSSRDTDVKGASSCIDCRRRLPSVFRQLVEGQRMSRSPRVSYRPALDDEWCRYCSRPRSEAAVGISKAEARPRACLEVVA